VSNAPGTVAANAVPYQAPPAVLGKAVIAAGLGAAAILVLFVLPAERGIDLTGAGKALGLTRMAPGAAAEAADSAAAPTLAATADLEVPPQTMANIAATTPWRSDEKTLTLAPHTGIEVKAHMAKGDHLVFRWTSTGPVRMDMHGEPKGAANGEFTDYWKEKNLTGAQGSFTAPFEGTHGWYWRNGGEAPATITLKTNGFYHDLFEPPAE
jgi:hypothetical protein